MGPAFLNTTISAFYYYNRAATIDKLPNIKLTTMEVEVEVWGGYWVRYLEF